VGGDVVRLGEPGGAVRGVGERAERDREDVGWLDTGADAASEEAPNGGTSVDPSRDLS